MKKIETIAELKEVLQKLCRNESLQYIEKHLKNKSVIFFRGRDRVIYNLDYCGKELER